MWTYNYNYEFYHHGIKGQRWGIRRFQKKDGSLTPEGKKRYDNDAPAEKKKSKHRLMLEERYKSHGLTQEEAEKEAAKRIRYEKIIVGAAAVTVAACAAYAISKKIRDRTDGLIKAGDSLQRIEMRDTGGKLNDVFFMSKGKHDNDRYRGLLGMTRHQQTGEAYLMKLQANSDIKVASKDKAAKIFGDLYKNDDDFRNSVKDHVSKHFSGRNRLNADNLSDRNIKKLYENFNANLINIRQGGSGADKRFYDKLKSSGYGAIQDINDMKFSGYNAKNPLIVFGNSDKISVKSVSKLNGNKAMAEGMKELGKSSVESLLKTAGPITAATLTATAASEISSDYKQQPKIQTTK